MTTRKTDAGRKWTQEETRRLHELRSEGLGLSAIAERLGRTRKSVEHKIHGKPVRQAAGRGKSLSETEMRWLAKHYKHTKNDEIMKRLGVSHSSLHRIAREHGLAKSLQFMRKTQTEAKDAAADSHRRNGTYPPKGYRIPGGENNRFKKGESIRDRLSPKRYAEMQEKRKASWRRTYDSDRRRSLAWGFEQRTKFRFVKQSRAKISYRYNLRKNGYLEDPEDHNLYYLPSEEMRRPRMESRAPKFGIRFKTPKSQTNQK